MKQRNEYNGSRWCGYDGLAQGRPLPVLIAALALLVGCPEVSTENAPRTVSNRPIRAVATTGMVGDMVRAVGGEQVDVTVLMGPGVDPHLFRASESHVWLLSETDVIFYNGLHLEAKLGDVLGQMPTPSVAIAESLPQDELLGAEDDGGGTHDPHLWLDASLWARAVPAVEAALAELAPLHAEVFAGRAAQYRAELETLHVEVLELVETLPAEQRVLVTAHDAFRYFGRAYGFEVVGLQGISTEAEAGTGDVQRLARMIAERKIPAIFVESSIPVRNIQAVQAAVKARGWDVAIGGELYSDALGDADSAAGTYIGMVRHNAQTIVDALKPNDE